MQLHNSHCFDCAKLRSLQTQCCNKLNGTTQVLMRLAGGPHVWLAMRRTFLSSLASGGACGYIAGVGDRHLDNILLEEATGALVPIDFGYSFDTAIMVSLLHCRWLLLRHRNHGEPVAL